MTELRKKKLASLSMIAILLAAIGTVGQMSGSNVAEAETGKQRIIFSADSNGPNSSLTIAKTYLTADSGHIMGQGYWQNLEADFNNKVYNLAPNNPRMMFASALQWMKDGVPIAKQLGVDYVAYNVEVWEYTPVSERTSPIESFNQAANIAHSNGFKFAYNPTMSIFKGPDVNYLKQDWAKADMVLIPYGGLVKLDGFKQQVTDAVNHIKTKNPDIEIYIFVSLRYGTPDQIIHAMDSVKTMVHGAAISHHPDSTCTYCSDANLNKIMAGITALSSAPQPTPTPEPTPTPKPTPTPEPTPEPTPTPTEDLTLLYSSGSTADATTNIAKSYITAGTQNYAAQSFWLTKSQTYNNEVYNAAPVNKKVMFASSLSALADAVPLAKQKGVNVLAYSAIVWQYSSSLEKNDPVAAFNQASQTAHNNGFKFGYAPSLGVFVGPDKNYLKQDWTKADVVILPYASMLNDPAAFKASVEQAVSHIKAENPNIQILVHISLKNSSPEAIISAVNSVRPVIDGTALTHNPQEPGCSYCSNTSLDKLLEGVAT